MVHSIWPRQRREDAMAATYNAQDFVGLQRELGMLAKYVVEMGGDIELFEISMRIRRGRAAFRWRGRTCVG